MNRMFRNSLGVFFLTFGIAAAADQWPQVVINGQPLAPWQLAWLESQLGARIPPGSYLLDGNGCWVNLGTGEGGCPQSVDVFSRYGSGEIGSDGSWEHYSDAADMGVGGTADGCIYTTSGWSNC